MKIYFQLDQDEDGYPPVAVESVWASRGAIEGEYIIDNVPFFTRDATLGDTITVREADGCSWFDRVVRSSGNSLIRVVFFDRSVVSVVAEGLASLGCNVEQFEKLNLMAVSVPRGVGLDLVRHLLSTDYRAGKIDYEEAILRQ